MQKEPVSYNFSIQAASTFRSIPPPLSELSDSAMKVSMKKISENLFCIQWAW